MSCDCEDYLKIEDSLKSCMRWWKELPELRGAECEDYILVFAAVVAELIYFVLKKPMYDIAWNCCVSFSFNL